MPEMCTGGRRTPPGPSQIITTGEDLLTWLGEQFDQYGDIFSASVYGSRVYVVRDPALVEHVLRRNWQNYVKGQAIKRVALVLGNGLMVSEGALWKRQRRMIQPVFHRDAIEALWRVIFTANAALLERWERAARGGSTVDVTADVSEMTLEIVLRSIFGADYDAVAPRFELVAADRERNLGFAHAFSSLAEIVHRVLARRRSENSSANDILGMLMQARDRETDRPMSDAQLVNEIKTLIVAGHETTASTLNWVWYLLSQHPEVQRKLEQEVAADPDGELPSFSDLPRFVYLRHIVDETLRLFPAGWLLTRRALHDDSLGEYFVPAGTEIYIPVYFIQRHPGLWPEPDRFEPERHAREVAQGKRVLAMLPFSAGPRNCIGEHLALVEMQAHVMMIARRLRLSYAEATKPTLEIGVNLRSRESFLMTPILKTSAGES